MVTKSSKARERYAELGLTYNDVTEGDILVLVMMLNSSIKHAVKVGELVINSMHLSSKIVVNKKSNGVITSCFIYINSNYFTQRECISFNRDGFIGFCGWADSKNEKPIIDAFLRWCDYVSGEDHDE